MNFSDPPKKSSSRRRSAPNKITIEAVSSFISLGFGIVGLSRPLPLQAAWAFSAEDCRGAAEPLAASLGGLPAHVMETALNIINPIAAGAALYSIYLVGKQREEMIIEQIRQRNGGAEPAGARIPFGGDNGNPGSSGTASANGASDPSKPSGLNYQ